MQLSLFSVAESEPPLIEVHRRLLVASGGFSHSPRLGPVDQLIKSMISSRTYDEVSWPAYRWLKDVFHPWERLAEATPTEIEAAIAQVTHAEIKAGWLPEALTRIIALKGALSLDFLATAPVEEAMVWLQRNLPGVGDKVAASVLNFSTLRRRMMVVDTHVWRVARRIGLAGRNADPEGVRRAIMDAAPLSWTADDFFDLHWLLKRLGQHLCLHSQTRCGGCPVAAVCIERQRALDLAKRRGAVPPTPFGRPGNKE